MVELGMQGLIKKMTEQDLEKEAGIFVDSLSVGTTATVVGLYGNLGAGKTAFVKAIASVFGTTRTVTSPTFVIEKVYKLIAQKFECLIHIDAYRLKDSSEIKVLGWDTLVSNPKNIIIVEWADIIEDILPEDAKRIYFKISSDTLRTLEFK